MRSPHRSVTSTCGDRRRSTSRRLAQRAVGTPPNSRNGACMTLSPVAVAVPVPRAARDERATTSTAGGRFPALDGLRAVAAFAVVLTHVGFMTEAHRRGGMLGVATARI